MRIKVEVNTACSGFHSFTLLMANNTKHAKKEKLKPKLCNAPGLIKMINSAVKPKLFSGSCLGNICRNSFETKTRKAEKANPTKKRYSNSITKPVILLM